MSWSFVAHGLAWTVWSEFWNPLGDPFDICLIELTLLFGPHGLFWTPCDFSSGVDLILTPSLVPSKSGNAFFLLVNSVHINCYRGAFLEIIRVKNASILEWNNAKVMPGLLRLQKLGDLGKWLALDIALDGLQQALVSVVLDDCLNFVISVQVHGISDQCNVIFVQSLVFERFYD